MKKKKTIRNTALRAGFAAFWLVLTFFVFSLPMAEGAAGAGWLPAYFDKIVHLGVFFVLSYLLADLMWMFTHSRNAVIISLVVSFFYAFWLENNQQFIPTRAPSAADLFFALIGIVLALAWWFWRRRRQRLLLHLCCGPCGAYISRELPEDYEVIVHFSNDNIDTKEEFEKRKKAAKKLAKKRGLAFYADYYGHNDWLGAVKGLEDEPERGRRCLVCYAHRLKAAAKKARRMNCAYLATSLGVSPYKIMDEVNRLGGEIAPEYGLIFLDKNFRKEDGYLKSVKESKKLGLYRQKYCGCEFGFRPESVKSKKPARLNE